MCVCTDILCRNQANEKGSASIVCNSGITGIWSLPVTKIPGIKNQLLCLLLIWILPLIRPHYLWLKTIRPGFIHHNGRVHSIFTTIPVGDNKWHMISSFICIEKFGFCRIEWSLPAFWSPKFQFQLSMTIPSFENDLSEKLTFAREHNVSFVAKSAVEAWLYSTYESE